MTNGKTKTPPPAATDPRRGWAGVGALAGATCIVVTSEMLPVGLLTPMGRELGVGEGASGLTLTVTGLVAALAAPLVVPAARALDRRVLLLLLMLVLAAGDLLVALAPGFGTAMAGRVLVGAGMAGVWTVAAPLAVRLVPARSAGTGTAVIMSGVAVASVLGVPAGTYLGDLFGWRAAFGAAAAAAVVLGGALAVVLPPLPAGPAVRPGGVLGTARVRRVRTGLVVVALLVTGHFAAYTFVRPVLERVPEMDAAMIGALLLAYGVAGVAGNFAGGALAARSPHGAAAVLGAGIAAAVLLLAWSGGSPESAAVLLVLWGLAYGGVSVTAQTWLQAAAPESREAASALFVGVFNAAIALGAWTGGLLADHAGLTPLLCAAGALALAAALTAAPRPAHRASLRGRAVESREPG